MAHGHERTAERPEGSDRAMEPGPDQTRTTWTRTHQGDPSPIRSHWGASTDDIADSPLACGLLWAPPMAMDRRAGCGAGGASAVL